MPFSELLWRCTREDLLFLLPPNHSLHLAGQHSRRPGQAGTEAGGCMKTLLELVYIRDRMDAVLAGNVDANVRFCVELSRAEVLNAIRAQSFTPEILEVA
jgi:hypothetical protein